MWLQFTPILHDPPPLSKASERAVRISVHRIIPEDSPATPTDLIREPAPLLIARATLSQLATARLWCVPLRIVIFIFFWCDVFLAVLHRSFQWWSECLQSENESSRRLACVWVGACRKSIALTMLLLFGAWTFFGLISCRRIANIFWSHTQCS